MPNTIKLDLLKNKIISATVEGVPYALDSGYRIIAGEENATIFEIVKVAEQYQNAVFSVEMKNAKGVGIEETDIKDKRFVLPNQMAVEGIAVVSICGYINDERVPWSPLFLKVWNTINMPNEEEPPSYEIERNYNLFLNKPKINGVELIGDKKIDDFGVHLIGYTIIENNKE